MNRALKCIIIIIILILLLKSFSMPAFSDEQKKKAYEHVEMTEEEFNRKRSDIKAKMKNIQVKKKEKPEIPISNKDSASLSKSKYDIGPIKKLKDLPKFDPSIYNDPVFDKIKVDMKTGKILWLPEDGSIKPFTAETSTPLELHEYEILDLERSIKIGLYRSTRIKSAVEQINLAVAQYDQIKTVKNTTLQLDGIAQLQGPSNSINLTIPGIVNEKLIFSRDYNIVGQLTLQQLITTFGRIEHNIAASFINIKATQEKMESEKSNVIYSIKQSFFYVLKMEALIRVAVDYVNQSKDYLNNAYSLYRNGMVSRYDVVRSELSVSEAMQSLVTAKMNYMLANANFLYNLDYSHNYTFHLITRERNVLKDSVNLEDLYASGMTNRHEIREMDENILAAKELLEAAKKNNTPSVYLSGQYNQMTKTSVSEEYSWNVGLSVTIPILDGGIKVAKIKEAESNIRYAEIAMESLKKQIKLQIEQSFLKLKEARVIFRAALKDVQTSEEGYRMSKIRYKNGLSTTVEMEDSIRTLNRSSVNFIDAVCNYCIALAELENSIGRDFTPEELEQFGGIHIEK